MLFIKENIEYHRIFFLSANPADSKRKHVREDITIGSRGKKWWEQTARAREPREREADKRRKQGATASEQGGSKRDKEDEIRPRDSSKFQEQGMVLQCGEGVRCGSLGNHFGVHFLWLQKATLGTTSCRPQAPSVLHCHGVLVWRVQPFWSQFLVDSESDVRPRPAAGCRCNKIIHPQPLGSAAGGVSPSYVYDVCVYKNIMKFNLQLMIDLLKYGFLCGLTIPFFV